MTFVMLSGFQWQLKQLLAFLNVFLTWNDTMCYLSVAHCALLGNTCTLLRDLFNCVFVSCAGVSISVSVQKDPATGLLTTSSTLEYSAMKEDTDAEFSCSTQHLEVEEMVSPVVTFTITCESPQSG